TTVPSSPSLHAALPIYPATPDPADAIAQRHELMAALAQLPPRQRACLVLRYFEDLSVVDTAGALGITPGTVKSQTSRALDTVRRSEEHTSELQSRENLV